MTARPASEIQAWDHLGWSQLWFRNSRAAAGWFQHVFLFFSQVWRGISPLFGQTSLYVWMRCQSSTFWGKCFLKKCSVWSIYKCINVCVCLGTLTREEPVVSVNLEADSDKLLFILHVCVCVLYLSLSTHTPHRETHTHTLAPSGRCFKAWQRCRLYCFVFHVSSIFPPSTLLLPPFPLPPDSLLMAQMWQRHTGSSLLQRQHKAVVSIFKHFGRRCFHVICNRTSVQLRNANDAACSAVSSPCLIRCEGGRWFMHYVTSSCARVSGFVFREGGRKEETRRKDKWWRIELCR